MKTDNLNNLKKLSPDLYLRYLYGFQIIQKIQKNKPCTILDVGGKAGIMGDFIKIKNLPYKLTVIDSLPDNSNKPTTCAKYIREDFKKYQNNNVFDYLVSFDVLEHVDDKKFFIEKCLSLSNRTIISAPFKTKIVDLAEKIIDNYFLKHKGIHHPWLIEHFEQNLPDLNWLKKILNNKKINYRIINSNNIENWVHFMFPNLLPALYSVDTKKLEQINKYYNENYEELGDDSSPVYRKLLITLPKGEDLLFDDININHKTNIQKKIIFNNKVIEFLTSSIKECKDVISNFESAYRDLKDSTLRLEKEIKKTKTEIKNYTKLSNQIIESKFFKIWQFYCKLKKML